MKNVLIIIIIIFSLALSQDTITMMKRGCLNLDNIEHRVNEAVIVNLTYNEGYSRGVHASYTIIKSSSVKLSYLYDSTKDVFLNCELNPKYITVLPNKLYQYIIYCYLQDISKVNDGTYCVKIVDTLIGDIKSQSFCSDNYKFDIIRTSNLPSLIIQGFPEDQSGCVGFGSEIVLLGNFNNDKIINQDYAFIGIGLSNTEKVSKNIGIKCKIEENISKNSNAKLTCIIPYDISEGFYSVVYSNNLIEENQCPKIDISSFNSSYFKNITKKLYIFEGVDELEAELVSFDFGINSGSSDLFILKFKVDNSLDMSNLVFDDINKKNIGIVLGAENGIKINTKCNITDKDITQLTFNMNCNAENYEKNVTYFLYFQKNVKIGYNKAEQVCEINSTKFYRNIIIKHSYYDFLITFNDEFSYLDCDPRNYNFSGSATKSIQNLCGSCGRGCIKCDNSGCKKCMDGFLFDGNSGCKVLKNKDINYEQFDFLYKYLPYNSSCWKNPHQQQLFSFIFYYSTLKGEIVAFESEKSIDKIFAKNENNNKQYGLNCTLDINPSFGEWGQHSGICREAYCSFLAYLNCSFHQEVPDGIYEILENTNTLFGKLINDAKDYLYLKTINIKYYRNKISANINEQYVQIFYEGYLSYLSKLKFLFCQNSLSNIEDCYESKDFWVVQNYDKEKDQSLIQCLKFYINEDIKKGKKIKNCITFKDIRWLDSCGKYSHAQLDYTYCNKENYEKKNDINLLMILFIWFLLFY